MSSRIDALKALLAQAPADARMQHMLANEYANAGLTAEALAQYAGLTESNPDYVPGYFQAGRLAEAGGDIETARSWYERGLETARRVGDNHAAGEIEAALDLLG
jgi:tetratricopeptide (TPR) repeat protein